MSAKVEVYSTTYCPYCRAAERLLDNKGVAYDAYDVTYDHSKREWLVKVTGRRTVPQIFIDGQPIGGFTDMQALDRQGRLNNLLGLAS
ncbi:MAG: glutaredoxin 3 [Candidatus Sericytochromatia bacterium]